MARVAVADEPLLAAAREELIAGEGQLDLDTVVRRAGVSTGALYHHFGSKAGLLAAVFRSFYDDLEAETANRHLPEGSWGARERERTRRFVAFHFGEPLAPVLLARVGESPPIAGVLSEAQQRLQALAASNIADGQAHGELAPEIDPIAAGAFVVGGLQAGIIVELARTPRPSVTTATRRLWTLVARATGAE